MFNKGKTEKLLAKWMPLLESKKAGPVKKSLRPVLAQLLENQQRYLKESGVSGDIARFEPVIIPVIRRVFPNLIANQLVAVQPMSMPSGLAFAMRYHYTNTGAAPISPAFGPVGLTNSAIKHVILTLADASGVAVGETLTTDGVGAGTGTVMYKEGNSVLVQVVSGTFAVGYNIDDTTPYNAAVTTVSAVYTNEAGYNFILPGYSGNGAGAGMTTAAAEALSTSMKEVGLSIVSTAITAKSRALKAHYSIEMAQDLRAVHDLDVESELATILSYEVQQEIDREIIAAIDAQAALNTGTVIGFDFDTADGRWEQEKFRNLYTRIVQGAQKIATRTRRGPGNFIVVNPTVATCIEAMDTFQASPVNTTVDATQIGVAVIGKLGNRFTVVKDTFRETNDIVVGYKGPSLADTGIVYSPYVPLTMLKSVGQDDFQPRIGFKTRYAITTDFGTESSANYYQNIGVTNLPFS